MAQSLFLHLSVPVLISAVLFFSTGPLSSPTAAAELPDTITLSEILPKLAETQDEILAAAARVAAARYAYKRSVSEWYPELNAFADWGYEYIDRPGDPELDLEGDKSYEWKNSQTLRLRQQIYDFGTTSGNIGRTKALWGQAEYAHDAITQEVLLAGIESYLEVYRAYLRLGYARRNEENIRRQTGIEESLSEKGAGLSSDLLQARSQLADATARRIAAEGALANALSYFNSIYQFELSPERIDRLTLPEVPFIALPATLTEAVRTAIEYNPMLMGLEKSVTAADESIQVTRSLFYPKLEMVADARRRENDVGITGVRQEFRALLEARWNIYNGGGDLAALREAKSLREQANRLLVNERRMVEKEVRHAWENYRTARENLSYLKQQVGYLERFLELARKERRLGNRTLLDVLTGESSYINSLNNALAAEVEQVAAAYRILFAMGKLEPSLFQ